MRKVVHRIVSSPRWLNASPDDELRAEPSVSREGIALLLLQRDPEHRLKWLPVASWGRCLDPLEQQDSRVLLELRALREGCWKLSEFTTYANRLVLSVSRGLKALLALSKRAHPDI